jgi:hypothetical protein
MVARELRTGWRWKKTKQGEKRRKDDVKQSGA